MGKIVKVSGPLIVADGMGESKMFDVVRVGKQRLIGEIIELRGEKASIEVYEETSGIGPGDEVFDTGEPLSVELAPGLIESIYDGIQRPLDKLREFGGDRIARGVEAAPLDHEKKWTFNPVKKPGDKVVAGDELGYVDENVLVKHKILLPLGADGIVKEIYRGEYTIDEPIAVIETAKGEVSVPMLRKAAVRKGRPYREKLAPFSPMITGQRVIDTFFPIARRRTRQRNDGRFERIPRIDRSENGRTVDETYRFDRQYLGHAGGGKGSQHLYGDHDRGIFPRHGI